MDLREHPLQKAEVSLNSALITAFLHETADAGGASGAEWRLYKPESYRRAFRNAGITHLTKIFQHTNAKYAIYYFTKDRLNDVGSQNTQVR